MIFFFADCKNLNAYYLHSDLFGQVIPTNAIYGQVISVIPVTAAPGNLIVVNDEADSLFTPTGFPFRRPSHTIFDFLATIWKPIN